MRVDIRKSGFVPLGVFAALIWAAPTALADPPDPTPVPAPPAQEGAAPATPQASQQGTPHLASPQNLPPGTSDEPVDPQEGHGLSYLRDLWHAVQTQDISRRDALLLLTQRPMDPNSSPPPGMASGPQAPPGSPPGSEPAPVAAPPTP